MTQAYPVCDYEKQFLLLSKRTARLLYYSIHLSGTYVKAITDFLVQADHILHFQYVNRKKNKAFRPCSLCFAPPYIACPMSMWWV